MSEVATTRAWPPVSAVKWDDTHRLIPASYADTDAPFVEELTENPGDVALLIDLMSATNARLKAQADALPAGIRRDELVFAVPHWRIVNAAFCYPHPAGSRFSGPDRGAWYAARFIRTSLREVAFHKQIELAETDWWELTIDYQDYTADIHSDLHDLRHARDTNAKACLSPTSYRQSQDVAGELLEEESLGIVYPSVRDEGRGALACFRPASVANVRTGSSYRLKWTGKKPPTTKRLP